jgi:beta-phosphoglucomutase-like phosphatase (HAD superfamily)
MSAIKGLAFDLDGVIADSATLHFAAWKRLADELRFTAEDNEALGVDRINSLRHILRLGQRVAGRRNRAPGRAQERLLRRCDLHADGGRPVARRSRAARRSRRARLRIGLASASRNAPALLERLGVAEAFEFIADPADHLPKPAPDLFLACARAFDLPPQAMIGSRMPRPGSRRSGRPASARSASAKHLPRADVQFATLADIDLAALLG